MNKILIISITVLVALSGCRNKCKDQPDANCLGTYVYRDGKCQCPENSIDVGQFYCRPYSDNDFWLQEGDACLGRAYIFFGKTGTDIFDEGQSTIEMDWTQGDEASVIGGFRKIDRIGNQYYLIDSKFNDVDHSTKDFHECIGEDYDFYDMEIKIDIEWTTANVTYKFWNDIDPSNNIKKEFGTELTAVFKNNTGPK